MEVMKDNFFSSKNKKRKNQEININEENIYEDVCNDNQDSIFPSKDIIVDLDDNIIDEEEKIT